MLSVQGVLLVKRREDRASGVVFMGNGGTKQCHEAIHDEWVDGALIGFAPVSYYARRATLPSAACAAAR
jgi:hypothetical protein